MKELLKIDLHSILRSRIPGWKGKLIPGFMISMLERFIHQNELNQVLETTYPAEGSRFSDKAYKFFDLTLSVEGLENIPASGRYVFVSNHPLGGLDGIGIIKVLGEKYGDENIRFLVNDMLMNVKPLEPVFLPINKYGAQGRAAAAEIAKAYSSDKQIIVFPAGLVSRLQPDGSIADLKWQKSFIQKAFESERDIIPMHFVGQNRPRFYKTAKWRKRLGIKVNIEQAMLPGEVCASRGKHFRLIIGKPIPWQQIATELKAGTSPLKIAAQIREVCYALKHHTD